MLRFCILATLFVLFPLALGGFSIQSTEVLELDYQDIPTNDSWGSFIARKNDLLVVADPPTVFQRNTKGTFQKLYEGSSLANNVDLSVSTNGKWVVSCSYSYDYWEQRTEFLMVEDNGTISQNIMFTRDNKTAEFWCGDFLPDGTFVAVAKNALYTHQFINNTWSIVSVFNFTLAMAYPAIFSNSFQFTDTHLIIRTDTPNEIHFYERQANLSWSLTDKFSADYGFLVWNGNDTVIVVSLISTITIYTHINSSWTQAGSLTYRELQVSSQNYPYAMFVDQDTCLVRAGYSNGKVFLIQRKNGQWSINGAFMASPSAPLGYGLARDADDLFFSGKNGIEILPLCTVYPSSYTCNKAKLDSCNFESFVAPIACDFDCDTRVNTELLDFGMTNGQFQVQFELTRIGTPRTAINTTFSCPKVPSVPKASKRLAAEKRSSLAVQTVLPTASNAVVMNAQLNFAFQAAANPVILPVKNDLLVIDNKGARQTMVMKRDSNGKYQPIVVHDTVNEGSASYIATDGEWVALSSYYINATSALVSSCQFYRFHDNGTVSDYSVLNMPAVPFFHGDFFYDGTFVAFANTVLYTYRYVDNAWTVVNTFTLPSALSTPIRVPTSGPYGQFTQPKLVVPLANGDIHFYERTAGNYSWSLADKIVTGKVNIEKLLVTEWNGDDVFIGASSRQDGGGVVYIYTKTNGVWSLTQTTYGNEYGVTNLGAAVKFYNSDTFVMTSTSSSKAFLVNRGEDRKWSVKGVFVSGVNGDFFGAGVAFTSTDIIFGSPNGIYTASLWDLPNDSNGRSCVNIACDRTVLDSCEFSSFDAILVCNYSAECGYSSKLIDFGVVEDQVHVKFSLTRFAGSTNYYNVSFACAYIDTPSISPSSSNSPNADPSSPNTDNSNNPSSDNGSSPSASPSVSSTTPAISKPGTSNGPESSVISAAPSVLAGFGLVLILSIFI